MGTKGTGEALGGSTGDETTSAFSALSLLDLCLLEGCCGVLEVEEVPPSPRTRFDILILILVHVNNYAAC